jgi:drug/metabolite transporter (DMT)-like permease
MGALGAVHFIEKLAITQGAPPGAFALGQTAVALALLWPVWLWRGRREPLTLWKSGRVRSLALIGVLASGIVVLLSIIALTHTTATHKGAIQAAYPLGTMLFAWLLLRERITLLGYVSAAVIVGGVVLLTSRGLSAAPNLGDWLLIGTVPVMGFSDAYAKKVLADVPPITVSLGRYLFGTLFLSVVLLVIDLGSPRELLPVWELVLIAGALAALAMGLFYASIDRIGPSLAAGLLAGAPVVTVTLEWSLLGERFTVTQILGVALVIAGVIELARQRRVRSSGHDTRVGAEPARAVRSAT